MEPLSTFVLTAAFIAAVPATRRPTWEVESASTVQKEFVIESSKLSLLPTPKSIATPETQEYLNLSAVQYLSPCELLKREVLTYAEYEDGWNGEYSFGPAAEAIKSATDFIEAVPSRLPLPRPMLSSTGEIGLYWGLDGGYAEVTFESTGEIVFFSRSNDGFERFEENLTIDKLDNNWFWSTLGTLDVVAKAA